jgi:hypothetical protein
VISLLMLSLGLGIVSYWVTSGLISITTGGNLWIAPEGCLLPTLLGF